MSKVALIYTTYPDPEAAQTAAAQLLDAGLIACANLIPGMVAVYRWQGKVETGEETAMVLKTTTENAASVIAMIEANHPYDTPAALTLDVTGGSAPFLDWIAAETR